MAIHRLSETRFITSDFQLDEQSEACDEAYSEGQKAYQEWKR
jgi:hypothetical protein